MDFENILSEMAIYDFDKPINVTIAYDDDNDNEFVKSQFFDCPTPKIYMEKESENFIEKSKISTYETKDRPTVIKISKNELVTNECCKKKNNKINKKECKKNKKSIKKIEKTELNSKLMKPEKETADRSINPAIHLSNKDNESKTDDKDSLKNNYSNRDSDHYIDDLLTKVAEALLHILEAYFNHLNNVQLHTNSNPRIVQESKRQFNRIKQHFFQICYCTTNIIILSRENDNQFTEYFFNHAMKLAESRNMKITVQQIQPLYYELISWAKQAKEIRSLPITPAISTSNNSSELRKHLSQPLTSSSKPYTSYNNSQQHSTAKVSIHNSESHKKEIRITLDPKLNNNQTTQNHTLNYGSQYLEKNIQPSFPVNDQIYTNITPLRYNNFESGLYWQNSVRNFYMPNVSAVAATPANIYRDSLGHHNRCMVVNCQCQNENIVNPLNTTFPPTYDESIAWKNTTVRNENEPEYSRSKQNEDMNSIDYVRSPDSGFISPQQLNSPLENVMKVSEFVSDQIIQEIPSSTVTPLITHVTSLNPRALHIAEGYCYVCRKGTKKKCLGCYQTYYCSYQCQKQDWGQHINICKIKSKNKQSTNINFH